MSAHEVIYEFDHDPDAYKAFLRDLMDGREREPWEIHQLAQRHGGIPVIVSTKGPRASAPIALQARKRHMPVWERPWVYTLLWTLFFLLWAVAGWAARGWWERVVG